MAEQINATVNFTVAKKLAEEGYDQNQFPQWCWHEGYNGCSEAEWRVWPFVTEQGASASNTGWYNRKWLAAPTHLQAFQFLEQERGCVYQRTLRQDGKPIWVCSLILSGRYTDPDSLILAILDHLKEQRILEANPVQSRSVQQRLAAQRGEEAHE